MVSNRFRIQIICRVVLLGATLALFMYLLVQTSLYMTTIFAGLISAYELYSLVGFVEKTNRSLLRFLESVRHSDFSQTFRSVGNESSIDGLNAEFNNIMEEFQRERTEKEESRRYLQTVVQHVGIGLISFNRDGAVEFINNAAKRLLKVSRLNTVQSLESFSPELAETLLCLGHGEKRLVKVNDKDEILHLAVYATEFMLKKERITLVSIHNIQDELEEQEMRAWQDLIRVLTHEIMNSVTPIASLASTVSGLLHDAETQGEENSDIQSLSETAGDMKSAVETIRNRSEGLLHFVDNYRNLTRVPKPDFKIFSLAELFESVHRLIKPSIEGKDIGFTAVVEPENLELTADPELIEQVLINLLLNAVEALDDRPGSRLELRGGLDDRDRVIIRVSDNGPGIIGEVIEKIFIPFFTTKPEGSGIGLSLSRQIIRAHGGSIAVRSEPNVETVFTLRF